MERSFINGAGLKTRCLKFLILMLLAMPAKGQEGAAGEWTSFASPKGDLTLAMPANPLVQKERDMIRIFCDRDGATLDFQVRPERDPKAMIKFAGGEFDDTGTAEIKEFNINKFKARARVTRGEYYSISIYIAGKNFYQITASAESEDNAVLKEFMSSVRIGGDALMSQPVHPPVNPIPIDTLAMSAEVKEALQRPDAGRTLVNSDSSVKLASLNPGGPLSRTALVLQRPRATYTDAARQANTQGEVVLFVQLRADGSVGKITVRKGLANGLTENAVGAAKRIKFLPAKKNGQPIDVYIAATYSFAIY